METGLKKIEQEMQEEKKTEMSIVFNVDEIKKSIKGIKRFNKPEKVWVQKQIKTKVETCHYNESTNFNPLYRIYLGKIGKGNPPILIFTEGHDAISAGDQTLFLKRLQVEKRSKKIEYLTEHNLEYGDLVKICKTVGVSTTDMDGNPKNMAELLAELIELQQSTFPIFFKPGFGVPVEELNRVDKILDVVKYAFAMRLDKDTRIDYIFSAFVPQLNPKLIKPESAMPFAAHTLLFTNPKVGKSSNAHFVGKVKERASEANLLGYATATDKVPGALDQATEPIFLDEIQEEKENTLWGKLHTYMEIGKTGIAKGTGIETEGWACVSFMGNPKRAEHDFTHNTLTAIDKIETLDIFRNTLTTITSNFKAFGSRIALLLFQTNLKEVKGKPVSEEERSLLSAILHTIAHAFRDEFTLLFHNEIVRNWLYAPFEKDYARQLHNFSENISCREIADFIRGQALAFRHMKGMALRLAWLDYLSDFIKTRKIDHAKIVELAKEHLQNLQTITSESFAYITRMEGTSEFQEYLISMMSNLKPVYLRFLLYSVFGWAQKNEGKKIAVFDEISGYYGQIKTEHTVGKYDNFFKVKEPILKTKDKSNDLLYPFGIKIIDIEANTPAIAVQDATKFVRFLRLHTTGTGTKSTNGTDQQPNQVVEEVVIDTKSTKSTSTPSLTPLQDLEYWKCKTCKKSPCRYKADDRSYFCAECAALQDNTIKKG